MDQSAVPRRPFSAPAVPASEQARLHAALSLIECLAGQEPLPGANAEQERIAFARYCAAPSLVRRRYDALAAETAAFAAAGLALLLRGKDREGWDPAPAAASLAAEMRRALAGLESLIAG